MPHFADYWNKMELSLCIQQIKQFDLSSGRMIGKAWECDRLYDSEHLAVENGQAHVASKASSTSLANALMGGFSGL